ncbi:hypothetical protein ACFO4O_08635 [Glaciecola siphonariae]|uniref:Uncharacterized protein n=1 Tax=Glaciecola siphonariae TaxID=521012 RepID=A0ABV9LVQ7_9ALTE
MYIPTQYLPINTGRKKPAKREAISFDKTDSNPDTATSALHSQVLLYDQREGKDRRKRNIKPLLDTRTGRGRRRDERSKAISITA